MTARRSPWSRTPIAVLPLLLAACGGGGGDAATTPPADSRATAAAATAQNNAECVKVQPFYWEVGDATGTLASGSIGTAYGANTVLPVASASKWLYASYVLQKRNGVLSSDDIRFLHFESGYTSFGQCQNGGTVASCLDEPGSTAGTTNGTLVPTNVDRFYYGGGHMQKHAALNGLGALANAGLAAEIASGLGGGLTMAYGEPQLAGGARLSAAEYAKVLRRILAGTLVMRGALGSNAVCTNLRTCPTAVSSPSPPGEQWSYSMGHWVEDTTNVSDGAFSSPGAFGFYPWIDKTKTYYGIVARFDQAGALDSMDCGRLIRRAWVTGVAQ